MAKKALVGKNLLPNTNYDVIVSLDDGDPDTAKQVKRFSFKTPKFIPKLNAYYPESTVEQVVIPSQTYTPSKSAVDYSVVKEYTFNIKSVWAEIKINALALKPQEDKVTLHIAFTNGTGGGTIDKSQIPSITGIDTTIFSAFFTNSDDISQSGNSISITKKWTDLSPDLKKADLSKKNNKFGFWGYDLFKALYHINKLYYSTATPGANQKFDNKNPWWGKIKGGQVSYTNTTPVHIDGVEASTSTSFTISSKINTKVPQAIIANSIDDYDNGVVDYFYFFIKQKGQDKWWCFNNDATRITPADTDSSQNLSGTLGSVVIEPDNTLSIDFPKAIKPKGTLPWQLTTSDLQARPTEASANVLIGESKTYKTSETKLYNDGVFSNKTFYIRFAVARYVKDDGGTTWTGKWMPNLATTSTKHEVSEILSAIETVSVG